MDYSFFLFFWQCILNLSFRVIYRSLGTQINRNLSAMIFLYLNQRIFKQRVKGPAMRVIFFHFSHWQFWHHIRFHRLFEESRKLHVILNYIYIITLIYKQEQYIILHYKQMKKAETKSFVALPIILLDELRSQDIKKRINSVVHLKLIANALGPERTRNQLLPFLNQFVDDAEDVLIALMNSLKDISPLIGGQSYEKLLIPLLINFARSDQKNISQQAISFIKIILKKMNLKNCEDFLWEVLKKLIQSDSMTGKDAALSLVVMLTKQINTAQLLEVYYVYTCDSFCQIRKIAAKYLKDLVINMKQSNPLLTQIIVSLLNDREDLIKILSIEGAIQYYPYNQGIVLDGLKNLLKLNSWRVNIKICELMPNITKYLTKSQFSQLIQKNYLIFLNNEEPQLRAVAFDSLEKVCSIMTQQDIVKNLLPIIQKLSKDNKPFVKIQVAKNFLTIAKFIPKESLNQVILPLLSNFLKDTDPEINLSVFSSLSNLSDSISAVQLQQNILICINHLFASNNWRTKCQAIDIMNQLVKHKNFINDKMITMIINWIFDKIDAVRMKAILLIQQLFKIYGASWAQSKLIPKIAIIQTNSNYLQRQPILLIIQRVIKHCSQQIINCYFYPILLVLSKDKVPNIRYLVIKILKANTQLLSSIKYKSIVEMMADDKDAEIKIQAKSIMT